MKVKESPAFPFYESINDFLESVTSLRAKMPLFYCLKLKDKVGKIKYKPPFRKGFYSIIFIVNADEYQLYFDNKLLKKCNSFLVLQASGSLSSYRYNLGEHTKGYVVFFKPEFFSFFKPVFEQEFQFFDILETNFFEMEHPQSVELQTYFEEVNRVYEKEDQFTERITSLKMLELLYSIKAFTQSVVKKDQEKVAQGKEGEVLFQNFLQLVSKFYLEKRTVKEYADLLSVTPNHLSLQIKKISNKRALFFINQKIINEAKSLISYTDYNINEVAKLLNFTDTSNFVKFFKSQTSKTPMEYKKSNSANH